MPNPVDKCASCGHPVYVEEGIPGGCGCPERDLRLLLATQRQKNASGSEDFVSSFVSRTASTGLPDLPPELLMSAMGQSEFQAAQHHVTPPFHRRPEIRGQTVHVAMLDDHALFETPVDEIEGFDGSGIDGELENALGRTAQQRQRHVMASTSAASAVDLSAMWMQGTGIPYDPGQLAADTPNDGFEFSTADDINMNDPRGGGGGAPRFRVDGPPPPRPVFNRAMVNDQGPMQETSRVRGRFAVLTERPERPDAEYLRAIEQQVREAAQDPDFNVLRPNPPPRNITAEQANARQSAVQQARVLQAKAKIPSVYDRLRKNPYT